MSSSLTVTRATVLKQGTIMASAIQVMILADLLLSEK